MTKLSIRGAAFCLALSLAVLPAVASVAQAQDKDPVVAVVNGKEIRKSSLIELKNAQPQLRQVPLEMVYDQLLEHAITGQLLLTEAKKAKMQEDPKVKQRLEQIRDRLIQEAYVAKQAEAKVTDAQVKAKYEELAKPREEVKARHILVESEDEAKAVIKQLSGGAKFEDVAAEKTKDPSGKTTGGDLGWFGKGDMVQPFAEAAFGMKPGEVSKAPVKTNFGWHVIKVEDKREVAPPPFEEVKEQIRGLLMEEQAGKVIEQLRSGADIKRFAADGSPKAEKK